MKARSAAGEELRVLRRLSIRGAKLVRGHDGRYGTESFRQRASSDRPAAGTVASLLARGLVSGDVDGKLILTDAGRALRG
jgi:hypothetical protein